MHRAEPIRYMDASQLALKMLEWETKYKELQQLEYKIREAVLALGSTQKVGNVRATYSGGRKSYDYKGGYDLALMEAIAEADVERERELQDILAAHTEQVEKTDWNAACKKAEVSFVPFTQSEPSVTLKLED